APLADTLTKRGIDTTSLALAFKVGRDRVHRLTVHGTDAVPLWKQLRKLVPRTNHWPILLGTDEDLEILDETLEDSAGYSTGKILKKAKSTDAATLFDDWHRTAMVNCREAAEEFGAGGDTDVQEEFERRLAQKAPFQGLPRGDW